MRPKRLSSICRHYRFPFRQIIRLLDTHDKRLFDRVKQQVSEKMNLRDLRDVGPFSRVCHTVWFYRFNEIAALRFSNTPRNDADVSSLFPGD